MPRGTRWIFLLVLMGSGGCGADKSESDKPNCPADAECGTRMCGDDPVCGISCGSCPQGQECMDGRCDCPLERPLYCPASEAGACVGCFGAGDWDCTTAKKKTANSCFVCAYGSTACGYTDVDDCGGTCWGNITTCASIGRCTTDGKCYGCPNGHSLNTSTCTCQ